jgi:hypothetical protein
MIDLITRSYLLANYSNKLTKQRSVNKSHVQTPLVICRQIINETESTEKTATTDNRITEASTDTFYLRLAASAVLALTQSASTCVIRSARRHVRQQILGRLCDPPHSL